jgi:hypothetical protein
MKCLYEDLEIGDAVTGERKLFVHVKVHIGTFPFSFSGASSCCLGSIQDAGLSCNFSEPPCLIEEPLDPQLQIIHAGVAAGGVCLDGSPPGYVYVCMYLHIYNYMYI